MANKCSCSYSIQVFIVVYNILSFLQYSLLFAAGPILKWIQLPEAAEETIKQEILIFREIDLDLKFKFTLIAGGVGCLISLFAMIATCMRNRCMLFVYEAILVIYFALQLYVMFEELRTATNFATYGFISMAVHLLVTPFLIVAVGYLIKQAGVEKREAKKLHAYY
jgi:hypothetical protein